ncbi:uncharacterized protein [Miscanthus floridulus]|uniref:uncharacterized protein n=1 Tax=Miscanthus floridulus TaxID=154761 RepID=UPI0034598451
MGHWAKECPNHKQEKKTEAHLTQADDDDEATLLMATFCALHDVEAKEKEEIMAVEVPRKALKVVNLDEPRAQVHLGRMGDEQEQRWYLDSDASNHMTGSNEAFSKLDDNVTVTMKFGDGSKVAIRGRGTIIFSIGQLDERGSEILIKDGVLMIRDREERLLAKVIRSQNLLYLLDLKVEQPVCLATRYTEEPWLWHVRFGHLNFDALGQLEKMVRELPHIKHTGEVCDSYLAKKQRRRS